ncbi:MAG: hypothetical protein JWM62_3274 [Frankiales bacterium]|jgi:glucose uptake protein GlcU|nr:hypothetical protein [Frankiales bacterium]
MVDTTDGNRSLNRTVALGFGVVYTLVGLAGFLVSENFISKTDNDLLGFQVNHLHNIVHLLIGVALIAASKRHDTARSANLAIGATYLLLGVLGPVINGSAVDIIALNGADNVLHLLSGVLLLGVALLADKDARSRSHA